MNTQINVNMAIGAGLAGAQLANHALLTRLIDFKFASVGYVAGLVVLNIAEIVALEKFMDRNK